jgi:hypothetical protein
MHEPLLLAKLNPPDPYWDKVIFLSHFDGGADGISFIDQKNHVIRAYNGAYIFPNGTPKFGPRSLAIAKGYVEFTGTDLELPGDFTIEGWYWFNALSGNTGLIGHSQYAVAGNGNFILRCINGNGTIEWISYDGAYNGATPNQAYIDGNVSGGIPLRFWNHIAVTRQNGTIRIFLNGVLLGTGTDNKILNAQSGYPIRIGASSAYAQSVDGNADDIRITKGVARYISDFTIPSRAFSDRGI